MTACCESSRLTRSASSWFSNSPAALVVEFSTWVAVPGHSPRCCGRTYPKVRITGLDRDPRRSREGDAETPKRLDFELSPDHFACFAAVGFMKHSRSASR
jgi:hypothetical protein